VERAPDTELEIEELDGEPVPDELQGSLAPPLSAASPVPVGPLPAQVLAVAAGGFLAGAATFALVRRRRARVATLRSRRERGPVGELVQIVGSRSLLVDVHLLGGRN
jgi:hypothetical protein